MNAKKTFLISLDAAEPALIEKWIEDGSLPNLKKAREKGAYGRVNSPNEKFIELPWLSFYNGMKLGEHGGYHHIQWISEEMKYKGISPEFVRMKPFWYQFAEQNVKTITVDVPLTPIKNLIGGIEINGYASYETLEGLYFSPKNLEKKLNNNIGKPIIFNDIYDVLSTSELAKIKNVVLDQTESLISLCSYLLDNEEWDMFLLVVSATHRGGHRLWGKTEEFEDKFNNDNNDVDNQFHLKEIYQTADHLIGELLAKIPEDSNIILFSLHGMGTNQSRTSILLELLDRIIAQERKNNQLTKNSSTLIDLIRKIFPSKFRHKVKNIFLLSWQRKLTSLLLTKEMDWSQAPAFEILGDYFGAIRINLIGREKEGIVAKGEEYNNWINIIRDGLHTFKDGESGEDIILEIISKEDKFLQGEYNDNLPDLLINWANSPSSKHTNIISEIYGKIVWPSPNENPDGRSGNHRNQGFFIGIGDGFKPNSKIGIIDIIDFAPTIINLLGLTRPNFMKGKIINNE